MTQRNIRIEEIWRPAPGYEGFYEVSNFGRAKRLACRDVRGGKLPERLLKVHVQKYNALGYKKSFVCFGVGRGDSKSDTVSIGRLVLLAFKGPPPSSEENNTRHLDDDITNNHISNLEWGTHKENVHDAIRNKKRTTYGEGVWNAKLRDSDAIEIRDLFRRNPIRFDIQILAKRYGVDQSTISNVINKITYKHLDDVS